MAHNVFESGARKIIPAVLIYVRRGDEILMLHRNAKPGDYHEGKWNGLGGKCEADESPLETASRELAEEAGLSLPTSRFRALGTLQFPNFKAHKSEDWIVFVLTATLHDDETPWARGPEGDLSFIPKDKILSLNLWPGDRHFIPYVLDERPFIGTLWYSGSELTRHWIQAL